MRHKWEVTHTGTYINERECTGCGLRISSTRTTKNGRWKHVFSTSDGRSLEPRGRMPKCERYVEPDWSDLQGFG